jgi:hypothetical protein
MCSASMEPLILSYFRNSDPVFMNVSSEMQLWRLPKLVNGGVAAFDAAAKRPHPTLV